MLHTTNVYTLSPKLNKVPGARKRGTTVTNRTCNQLSTDDSRGDSGECPAPNLANKILK